MKVVAGSHGNDAIGPLTLPGGGSIVWPDEWGLPKAGSVHFGRDFLLSHGRRRVAEVRRCVRPFWALSHELIVGMARRSFVRWRDKVSFRAGRPVS